MDYLNKTELEKVDKVVGYYSVLGKDYERWFWSDDCNNKSTNIDPEEIYRIYDFNLKEEYFNKIINKLPSAYSFLSFIIVSDSDEFNDTIKYKLCYREYNTSSPFALFLCNCEYDSFEEDE
jgi:hypothetical protein